MLPEKPGLALDLGRQCVNCGPVDGTLIEGPNGDWLCEPCAIELAGSILGARQGQLLLGPNRAQRRATVASQKRKGGRRKRR